MLLPRPRHGPESWSHPLCKTGWVEIHPGVPSQPGMGVGMGVVGRFTGMLQAEPPAQPWALAGCVLCAQSCPALCNPLDCSPPGSSVPGILQARILEWVAIPISRGSS